MQNAINVPAEIAEKIAAGFLFVINHSAGKDSQAMAALLADVIPADQILVVHAELPGADWDGLEDHIRNTIPAGWPLVVTRAKKTFFDMVERRHASRPNVPSWPSASTRQCTSDLKRDPIAKVVRAFLTDNPRFKGRAVHCTGLRAEESTSRSRAPVLSFNKRESAAGREIWAWLPIHNLLEGDVFDVIAAAGQVPHAAYAAGMSRLSCCFCIMARKSDLQTAARLRPDLYAKYCDLEARTGYAMSMAGRPLPEVTGIAPRRVIPITAAA